MEELYNRPVARFAYDLSVPPVYTQSKTSAFILYAGTGLVLEAQEVNRNVSLPASPPGRDSGVSSKNPTV